MASTVLFDAQLVSALREGGRKGGRGGWEGQRQLQRAFLKPDQVIYPAVLIADITLLRDSFKPHAS